MKKTLALLSVLLMLTPVLAQPIVASSRPSLSFPDQSRTSSPLAPISQNCVGCAGYWGSVASGYITKITAQWTVPTVTCQPALPDDQGLWTMAKVQGYDTATSHYTGVALETGESCATGSSTPTNETWLYYQSATTGFWLGWQLPFVLTPGHKMSATVSVSPSTGKITVNMKDMTDGQSASITTLMSYWGVAYSYLTDADWSVTSGTDLAQYAPAIKFTKCDVVVSGATHPISWLSTLYEYQMVDSSNSRMATTSSLNGAGNGFSITFVSSTSPRMPAQPIISGTGSLRILQSGPYSPQVTTLTCYGCAGYWGEVTSGTITKIAGQWTVPTVACQPTLSTDQALGTDIELSGYDSATTHYTGVLVYTQVYCAQGSSTPDTYTVVAYHSASTGDSWVSYLPLVLTPGHKLSGAISLSPSTGKMTTSMKDLTDGQSVSYTTLISYWGIASSYLNQVEWMANSGDDLAQFNPAVKFTGCDLVSSGATHPISWLPELAAYQMEDLSNNIMATVSPLNTAGTGFSVQFISST